MFLWKVGWHLENGVKQGKEKGILTNVFKVASTYMQYLRTYYVKFIYYYYFIVHTSQVPAAECDLCI